MRWDKELECKLREYPYKKKSIENMREKLAYLESSKYSLKPVTSDKDPVKGGSTKQEDVMLNKIMEISELKKSMNYVIHDIKWVERGLKVLDSLELKVIEGFYLLEYRKNKDLLADELGYSKQHIYRIKDSAIHKMTLALYGNLYS